MSKVILFSIPIFILGITVYFAVKAVKTGHKAHRVVGAQLACFVIISLSAVLLTPVIASAQSPVTTAPETSAETQAAQSSSSGWGLMAAALATGLAGIGGGIAVAAAAPAAIGATSEDPKVFGKALIFVALGEGIALYGLLISILILNKI